MGVEGEDWFTDRCDAIAEWVVTTLAGRYANADRQSLNVLDVGSGNGLFVKALSQLLDPPIEFVGVDYSPSAIEVSNLICKDVPNAKFYMHDVLADEKVDGAPFACVHDKGTLDVFLMLPADEKDKAVKTYMQFIQSHLEDSGVFCLTSCNSTASEMASIVTHDGALVLQGALKHPTISFGGVVGSTLTTMSFVKHSGALKCDVDEDW
eukprot:GHVO01041274.1.p1 GENE.GHVO01041274.1~~GHVO01041274.1.p1  ORF type:complete len:208 (+),score=37.96 GHVO01041274.1:110-733(+)